MSWWTDIIIGATALEEGLMDDVVTDGPAIEYVNRWLVAGGLWPLLKIEHSKDCSGRSPSGCWYGSFKNINKEGFFEAVNEAPWEWPEQISIFERDEDDKGWRVHRIRRSEP